MMYDEHRRDTDGRGVPDVETHIGKTCGDDLACAIELMYEARALIGAGDTVHAVERVDDALGAVAGALLPQHPGDPFDVACWLRGRWVNTGRKDDMKRAVEVTDALRAKGQDPHL